ncbi:DUF692 domain-containing protein [Streptomyces sp. G2]|uniref:DUF692 domain-containing protein n=1 Tax=Streptomyces TaxID=1883 RepID=UPI00202E226C|nr:DUF692 family multinuclear iron-containing protein [Streptomyces sp. G2]MCM1951395.1 DUF692 domain-containing protein [Streptomyces sp. G2]
MDIAPVGIGLQYNPEVEEWFPFDEVPVDALEVLLDSVIAPLDSPHTILPDRMEEIERLVAADPVVIAHSNYGAEFGFEPLERTAAVRRHVPAAQLFRSPWMSDHCFYGDGSWSDIWSSPVQFSRAEVDRIAERAGHLQELLGIPLAHENAAYYVQCPGADMAEPDFLAALVEKAGTYLHIDLHNIHTNVQNHGYYTLDSYLDALPLDRVVEIHVAGGSWSGGVYHDWHDSKVPEPVWEILEELLTKSHPAAVVLEVQGRAHSSRTRELEPGEDAQLILGDLERATRIWDRVYGPHSRRTTAPATDSATGEGR